MTWTLAFPATDFADLRGELLARAPLEAGAILLGNRAGPERLVIEEIRLAGPGDCRVQGADSLEFKPEFLAAAVKLARANNQSVIVVHTHPFTDHPEFSRVDDLGEAALIPAIYQRAPDGPHGALVLGRAGYRGRIHCDGSLQTIHRLVEIGAEVRLHSDGTDLGALDAKYDRNIRAFGEAGQRRLQSLTAAVVGLGGTGSIVAQQLAHLGVGHLILIDDDHIATTNLNRVVGAGPSDVGRPKAEVASDHVARISGGALVAEAVVGNVLDHKIGEQLIRCDVVFGCTDGHGSRALINQVAYQYLIPTIDMGLRIDATDGRISSMAGRVQMLAPGLACLQCQTLLDPEAVRRDFLSEPARRSDPYIVGEVVPQPAVISLNSVISSLAATMLLAALADLPVPARRLNYRIAESLLRPVNPNPNPDCVVCSPTTGALAKGQRWPLFWRPSV